MFSTFWFSSDLISDHRRLVIKLCSHMTSNVREGYWVNRFCLKGSDRETETIPTRGNAPRTCGDIRSSRTQTGLA